MHGNLKTRLGNGLLFLVILTGAFLCQISAQQSDSKSGRLHYSVTNLTGIVGNEPATTVFTPAYNGLYAVYWDLQTTTTGSAGTITTLTLTWNNGSSQSKNIINSQTLDLTTLNAEISGMTVIDGTTAAAVQVATTGAGVTGNPQYSLSVRVVALDDAH